MSETVIDPVCGMQFDPRRAASTAEVEGRIYYFCSVSCAREFQANPPRYSAGRSEAVQE